MVSDVELLGRWLLEKIGGDAQTARAMPHAIENFQSRWSPAMLIADCESKARIVQHCMDSIAAWRGDLTDSTEARSAVTDLTIVLKLMGVKYAHLKGYDERWRP